MLSDSLQLLIAGFSMGWGPCLVYAAPLLFPYIGATGKSWRDGLKVALSFSFGRFLALCILGGLVTFIFRYIHQLFPPHRSNFFHLAVALFMLVMGVLIILGKGFRFHIGERVLRKSIESIFIIGFIIGIAPCGPYVAILTYIASMAEGAFLKGVAYAAMFALGTACAPIALGAVVGAIPQRFLKAEKLKRVFQLICGAIIVGFGGKMIYSFVWFML